MSEIALLSPPQTVDAEEVIDAPWARQPKENMLWYGRFETYRLLGPGRTIVKAFEEDQNVQLKINPDYKGSIKYWQERASKGKWQERAEAWDQYQLNKVAAGKEKEWESFRVAWRQKEREVAIKVLEKVEQMLQFPVAKITKMETDDGRVQTIIMPMQWGIGDVANLIAQASKLARLAAEMDTDRKRVTIDDLLAALPEGMGEGVRRQLADSLSEE